MTLAHKSFEVETKYRVKNLKLTDFVELATSWKPTRYVETAGYDYYFVNEDLSAFCRFRAGDRFELTTKKKTVNANNFIREEYNLLIAHGEPLEKVAGFCKSIGYPDLNFKIYKSCFIYFYETFDLVYYIVFDENMKETDRFVEIEMLEDYPWDNSEQAWNELVKIEAKLETVGISKKNRLNKSLFEMYKRPVGSVDT